MTMARNVRSVLDEIDELHQKVSLYQEIQAFIGKHIKEDTTDIRMAEGGFVSADAANDLVADIDATVEGFNVRIKGLESSEVKDGKGEPGEKSGGARKKNR